jgi:nucleoside-diphosphate-sugar epimerase
LARLPFVYGPYSPDFMATVLSLACVFKHFDSEMKWLWTKDLRTDTAHIDDVVRALWAMATWQAAGHAGWDPETMGPTPIFNVVDKGSTTQGELADMVAEVMAIKTSFYGQHIRTFERHNLESVVADVNEEVLGPWVELLAAAGITRPGPLSPSLESELLKDMELCMDGSRLENMLAFEYEKPRVTKELVAEVLESYKRMNWWPA